MIKQGVKNNKIEINRKISNPVTKYNLSMLGIKLFGNAGLLIHGDYFQSVQRKAKEEEKMNLKAVIFSSPLFLPLRTVGLDDQQYRDIEREQKPERKWQTGVGF